MHRFVVPLTGSLAVVTLASVLIGVIVLRSPDTHANLWAAGAADYARTPLSFLGQEVGDVELALDVKRLQSGGASPFQPGRAVFLTRSCGTCHGLDARGGPVAPSLAGASFETLKRMARQGRGGMPAFTEVHLSEADLVELAAYLGELEVARPDPQQVAALQRFTYDPSVPEEVLLKGKAAVRRSCGACHDQPGQEDIRRAFSSDAEAAGLVAEMVQETNLGLEDAQAITHYMLAVRNGADPLQAPGTER